MIQGQKMKYICVEVRSHTHWDERPVETGLNRFLIGPTIFFKMKDQQLDCKRPVHK
jgi:hypothetical protein